MGDAADEHRVVAEGAVLEIHVNGPGVPCRAARQGAIGEVLLDVVQMVLEHEDAGDEAMAAVRLLLLAVAVNGMDKLQREPCSDGAVEPLNSTSWYPGLAARTLTAAAADVGHDLQLQGGHPVRNDVHNKL